VLTIVLVGVSLLLLVIARLWAYRRLKRGVNASTQRVLRAWDWGRLILLSLGGVASVIGGGLWAWGLMIVVVILIEVAIPFVMASLPDRSNGKCRRPPPTRGNENRIVL